MAKSASLTPLLVKKGTATPVTPPIVTQIKSDNTKSDSEQSKDYFKALTVKLDKERYFKLKQAGLQQDRSSQEIFVMALDAYLDKLNA